MPNGWVHAVQDLIAFGRPYFELRQKKDAPSKTLGARHREINHEWYNEYGHLWTHDDPFPDIILDFFRNLRQKKGGEYTEEQMVWASHDYLDCVWDDLDYSHRKYWEGWFAWVLFNPEILKSWAGVDIAESKILRMVENKEVWEYEPGLKPLYENL
ncbi:MAG: hypothetical protein ACE5IR_28920, partial [bacterium]